MSRNKVAILSVVLFVLIVGIDIILALDGVRANTFSAVWRSIPDGGPLIVTFGLGVVVGHIWWGK